MTKFLTKCEWKKAFKKSIRLGLIFHLCLAIFTLLLLFMGSYYKKVSFPIFETIIFANGIILFISLPFTLFLLIMIKTAFSRTKNIEYKKLEEIELPFKFALKLNYYYIIGMTILSLFGMIISLFVIKNNASIFIICLVFFIEGLVLIYFIKKKQKIGIILADKGIIINIKYGFSIAILWDMFKVIEKQDSYFLKNIWYCYYLPKTEQTKHILQKYKPTLK